MSNRLGWQSSNILGIPVAVITAEEFTAKVIQVAAAPELEHPVFFTYLNAACSNIAADDAEYREILIGADCVYADGQSIVWASGAAEAQLPARVNAGDFIITFLEAARNAGLSLALVGGRSGVAVRAADEWQSRVPGLQIKYVRDGYFSDDASPAEDVAAVGADMLLVGLGVPLQEKWAWEQRHDFGVKVVWCVGALFEYYGEGRRRAPHWMRRAGLEWLFRLCLEPHRLWRRYLVGNLRFVWRVYSQRKP